MDAKKRTKSAKGKYCTLDQDASIACHAVGMIKNEDAIVTTEKI